jgi:hypothetical protein
VINENGLGSAPVASQGSQKRLPNVWASNSKYSCQIELQVTSPSSMIALIPGGLSAAGGGWEWKY